MIRMKALKSFMGREGMVRAGREFSVADKRRADELARMGYAMTLASPPAVKKLEGERQGVQGPFVPDGGATGGETSASSSAPGRPRRNSRSKPRKGDAGSSQ
ncbi:MAG: hypothetical protein GC185_13880 [Alphaproteobacteria bacterium]|nr:hypothetical protein [Alphaproteobacteria bacterium]